MPLTLLSHVGFSVILASARHHSRKVRSGAGDCHNADLRSAYADAAGPARMAIVKKLSKLSDLSLSELRCSSMCLLTKAQGLSSREAVTIQLACSSPDKLCYLDRHILRPSTGL